MAATQTKKIKHKRGTVAITTYTSEREGKSKPIVACTHVGPLSVHRELNHGLSGMTHMPWTITHTLSGNAVGPTWNRRKDAIALAHGLLVKFGIAPWMKPDPFNPEEKGSLNLIKVRELVNNWTEEQE